MVMKLSSCACLLPLACSLLPSALAEGLTGAWILNSASTEKPF